MEAYRVTYNYTYCSFNCEFFFLSLISDVLKIQIQEIMKTEFNFQNDISLKLGETRLITPFWEEPPDRSGNMKVYYLLI